MRAPRNSFGLILFIFLASSLNAGTASLFHTNYVYTQTVVNITTFEDFQLLFDNDKIRSNNTGSKLLFQGGNFQERPNKTQNGHTRGEEYLLNIERLVGNCTSFELRLEISYYYLNNSAFDNFTINLASNYNSFLVNDSTTVFSLNMEDDHVIMDSIKIIEIGRHFNLDSQIYGSYLLNIKKKDDEIFCNIRNSLTNKSVTKQWFSYNFYLPLHYMQLGFYSNSEQNSLELRSINCTLKSEAINWVTLQRRALSFYLIEISSVCLLVLLMISTVVNKLLTQKERKTKERAVVRVDFIKYLQLLEQALVRAEERKVNLSREELAQMTPAPFAGAINDEQLCMICKLPLTTGQEILQCPLCDSLYHKKHLQEWLAEKEFCPVCNEPLHNTSLS